MIQAFAVLALLAMASVAVQFNGNPGATACLGLRISGPGAPAAGTPVWFGACGKHPTQEWDVSYGTGPIRQRNTNLCVAVGEGKQLLVDDSSYHRRYARVGGWSRGRASQTFEVTADKRVKHNGQCFELTPSPPGGTVAPAECKDGETLQDVYPSVDGEQVEPTGEASEPTGETSEPTGETPEGQEEPPTEPTVATPHKCKRRLKKRM